ncbi:60S ribosomal protein L15 [Ancistrocladus abbreviatus]
MNGFVIYRICVKRGGRKRPVPKGICVTQPKFQHGKRSFAAERAGWKLGGLRVLNSYWIHDVCPYFSF